MKVPEPLICCRLKPHDKAVNIYEPAIIVPGRIFVCTFSQVCVECSKDNPQRHCPTADWVKEHIIV